VFDCADPDRLAHFWADALGYKLDDPPAGFDSWEAFLRQMQIPEEEWNRASAIVDPDGRGPRVFFQRVPEGKVVKNRMHLDLNVTGGPREPLEERKTKVYAEADRLVANGATRVREVDEPFGYCLVMRDPDGNEFCLH
jgi:catechol 2,3-dioxygenase-like lactoylglutathione lyase family enzyme